MEVPRLGVQSELQLQFHHSHSNTVGSEPCLQHTPQLMTMPDPLTHWARPGIKPMSLWILVRFITAEPWWEPLELPDFKPGVFPPETLCFTSGTPPTHTHTQNQLFPMRKNPLLHTTLPEGQIIRTYQVPLMSWVPLRLQRWRCSPFSSAAETELRYRVHVDGSLNQIQEAVFRN